MARQTRLLFDRVRIRLPLFDGLPDGASERLSAGGYGRGFLTAALRARLRRAGLVDMGTLALATPIDLMSVRRIGPARVDMVRTHVLNELCRLYPDARATHSEDATRRRRTERLRNAPITQCQLDAVDIQRFGRGEATSVDADLSADLDRIADTIAQLLLPAQPRARPITILGETEDAKASQERAAILREREREWDDAAPTQPALPAGGCRPKS